MLSSERMSYPPVAVTRDREDYGQSDPQHFEHPSEPSQGTEEDQGASTSIWKARVGLKKEQDYRELSDRSVRSLEGSEREILEMHSKVTSLNGRVEVLEKLLAEVD
jgi:hypothetical protein